MTVVLKYDKRSVGDLERIEKNARELKRQLDGRFRDENLVVTVAAMGDIRERIGDAIYVANAVEDRKNPTKRVSISPDYVFQEFEKAFKDIGEPKELRKLSNEVYSEFNNYLTNVLRKDDLKRGNKIVEAMMYLMGDRLSSSLVSHVFRENGIDCCFVDYKDFSLLAKENLGDSLNAVPDLAASREKAGIFDFPSQIIILPAHLSQTVKKTSKKAFDLDFLSRVVPAHLMQIGKKHDSYLKDFGKGGAYTSSFALGYAFMADVWNLTDSHGLKTAKINGIETETVKELDIGEAMDAGRYGAKLPSSTALEPLEKMYEEGSDPKVFIAYSQDLDGKKTRILRKTDDNRPVKLISCRDIEIYEVKGCGAMGLTISLYKNNVDPFELSPTDEKNRVLGIPVETSKRIASDIIRRFEKTANEKNRINISSNENYSIVGIVGSPMAETVGVGSDAYEALKNAGINVKYGHHLSDRSIGFVIKKDHSKLAQEVLYRKFFGPKNSGY